MNFLERWIGVLLMMLAIPSLLIAIVLGLYGAAQLIGTVHTIVAVFIVLSSSALIAYFRD